MIRVVQASPSTSLRAGSPGRGSIVAGINPAFETPGYFQASLGTLRSELSERYSSMRKVLFLVAVLLLLTASSLAQGKRLWVLRSPGEMVEYDPATFAMKQTIKVPAEAVQSPEKIRVNHLGQILLVTPAPFPLAEEDVASAHKVWFWNGHIAATIDQGVKREVTATGSNQAVTETGPMPFLSADGGHLFWFASVARRLVRDGLDLSTATTWQAWQTDLQGTGREELATTKLPDCRCETGVCEESCPYVGVWAPEGGIGKFFLTTQSIARQTEIDYTASTLYREEAGKWTASPLDKPLQRELDASSGGDLIVEAIPDAGCCGWVNESNDQTLVRASGKTRIVFDERASYKNPDYDVSFYTSNALLSPEVGYLAMTIETTAKADQPIQIADQGEANPEELQRIRKALAELPAVEVKSMEDTPRQVAFVPHVMLVGWISEKEILIVEDHLLVAYNVGTGARRKSSVRVEDVGRVFLR